MGKKEKFKAGLDALFEEPAELSLVEIRETAVSDTKTATQAMPSKRQTHKNFIGDLETLLQDALQGAVEQKADKLRKSYGMEDTRTETEIKPSRLMGLDALIRRTDETTSISVDYSATRRVTFVFDNRKIEKLKTIASTERKYIKDIVNSAVTHFIEEYERKKGKV